MKFLQYKDKKVRTLLKKREIKNTFIKFLSKEFGTKFNIVLHRNNLFSKNKNFSKTKIVRRCILTNRSRGNVRGVNISRIKFKELIYANKLPGYERVIW